ncbi:AMP-binding protein [Saccharopolyspora sp. 5N708]|uniref:AMP-binding protein n=1 Tax=Saccharopolyspora sp. 5N708 TaxID=3457424 RepID=UPI003FD241BE
MSANRSTIDPHAERQYVGFYQRAAAQPDRLAIITPRGVEVTFGELGARVNRISHALRSLGLSSGDVVAAVVHNGVEYFELVLATGQVGLYLVPINYRLAPPEMVYIITDCGARVVVAHAEQAGTLEVGDGVHRYVVGGEIDGWLSYSELVAAAPDTLPEERAAGAVMGYTSGTTGRPKGVRRPLSAAAPERSIEALALANLAGYGVVPGDGVHLVCSPLYHAAPGNFAVWFLHAGHTVVVHERFDAEATLRAIDHHRVTSSHMVPTHFHRMLSLPPGTRSSYDLSSMRVLIHAGAPCPVAVKQQMFEWVGPIIWEYLGATEGLVTRISPDEWLTKPGAVGRPLPGVTVRIRDESGVEQPRGQVGTIYFTAPEFEYHNNPDATAAVREDQLVTVGDVGYVDDDGYLFMADRRTDLIVSGGVNIYPAEIEQRLITHPAVADAAVVGVPDEEWGQSVLAVVQPMVGVTPSEELAEELRAYCSRALAGFKRPRRIEFLSDFPRTESGKLQRRALRDTYRGGK